MRLDFGPEVQEIVNLTPHDVTIAMWEDNPITLKSEGLARVEEKNEHLHFLHGGLEINRLAYGEVTGLPPSRDACLFLVSRIVMSACQDRADLVAPGDLTRDAQGKITGCNNLVCNVPLLNVPMLDGPTKAREDRAVDAILAMALRPELRPKE